MTRVSGAMFIDSPAAHLLSRLSRHSRWSSGNSCPSRDAVQMLRSDVKQQIEEHRSSEAQTPSGAAWVRIKSPLRSPSVHALLVGGPRGRCQTKLCDGLVGARMG